MIYVESILIPDKDPDAYRAQHDIVVMVNAQHRVNYNQMRKDFQKGNGRKVFSKKRKAREQVEAHLWVLENAAIRGRTQGLTVFGLLRIMIDFRSRIA